MKNEELNYDQKFQLELSNLLKNKRLEMNYTTAYVSSFLKINTLTYLRYENNERSIPLSVFKRACSLYNINYHQTFKMIDEKIGGKSFKYLAMPSSYKPSVSNVDELFERVNKLERIIIEYANKK